MKKVKDFDIKKFYCIAEATTKTKKLGVCAIVYSIITEPGNRQQYVPYKDEIKEVIFKDFIKDEMLVELAIVAGYSCNDLADAIKFDYKLFEKFFEMLDNMKLCEGFICRF